MALGYFPVFVKFRISLVSPVSSVSLHSFPRCGCAGRSTHGAYADPAGETARRKLPYRFQNRHYTHSGFGRSAGVFAQEIVATRDFGKCYLSTNRIVVRTSADRVRLLRSLEALLSSTVVACRAAEFRM